MMETSRERRAEIVIRLSEFDIPPMQDVLVIGKAAPIGPEAARRMVDALSPEQYEVIPVDAGPVEALVMRKNLLLIFPRDRLIRLILEETADIAAESSVLKAQVSINLVVSRKVDL